MKTGGAAIVAYGENGIRTSAAAARISTTKGGALEAFRIGDGAEKDLKLIGKVLSSGHQTIVEHQHFTIAFHDVSVLAEQLLIEFRLASYTVKSRRYVDFSGAGYVIPEGLTEAAEAAFRADMDEKFAAYNQLLEWGIPREDARFVLPYCFKSNFYMTLNARELAHVIASMTKGRMSRYPEMRRLGESLIRQLDERFPGVSDMEAKKAPAYRAPKEPDCVSDVSEARQTVSLAGCPQDAEALLQSAMAFSGRFSDEDKPLRALVHDARPRELEMLHYSFSLSDISLACVTHFTRHRVQSLMVPPPENALAAGKYVVPDTVRQNAEALALYEEIFRKNASEARAMLRGGMGWETLVYYALAGHTVPLMLNMNARELLHFLKLRTCARAQWEIRAAAGEMLSLLMEDCGALFRYYGPSCAVNGFCPEGRLSCGRIHKTEA